MRHEEHVVVAKPLQYGRKALTMGRHGAFHQIAEHHRGEAVERGCHAVVGMDAGAVEIGESQRVLVKRVERRRERQLLTELPHQTGRHRLHEDYHDVGFAVERGLVDHLAAHDVGAVHLTADAVGQTREGDGLVVGHEPELTVLLAHVIHDRRQKVEGRIDAQLVEEGIVAIVSLADLDGVVARAPTDAEQAEQHQHHADGRTTEAVHHAQLRQPRHSGKTGGVAALQLHQPPDEGGRDDDVSGEVKPIRLLLQQHAGGGGDVAEPPEDARVDVLEEVSEIGNIGRRCRKSQGKPHAAPNRDATP